MSRMYEARRVNAGFIMNSPAWRNVVLLTALLGFGAAVAAWIWPASPRKDVADRLAGVPVLEIPDAAVRLVREAEATQRPAVTRELIRQVGTSAEPGVTPFVVNALRERTPEAATNAVSTVPEMRSSIPHTASDAGPLQTPERILLSGDLRSPGVWLPGRAAVPRRGAQRDPSPALGPPGLEPPATPKSGPSTELNVGNGRAVRPDTTRDYSAP